MLTQFTPPEHIPVFRALLEIEIAIARARHNPHQSTDKARSAPVRPRKKNRMGRGQTHTQTLRLLDQLGPEGRLGENEVVDHISM